MRLPTKKEKGILYAFLLGIETLRCSALVLAALDEPEAPGAKTTGCECSDKPYTVTSVSESWTFVLSRSGSLCCWFSCRCWVGCWSRLFCWCRFYGWLSWSWICRRGCSRCRIGRCRGSWSWGCGRRCGRSGCSRRRGSWSRICWGRSRRCGRRWSGGSWCWSGRSRCSGRRIGRSWVSRCRVCWSGVGGRWVGRSWLHNWLVLSCCCVDVATVECCSEVSPVVRHNNSRPRTGSSAVILHPGCTTVI